MVCGVGCALPACPGVGGATDDKLWQMAPFLVAGTLVCAWTARGLNMLGLGDERQMACDIGRALHLAMPRQRADADQRNRSTAVTPADRQHASRQLSEIERFDQV